MMATAGALECICLTSDPILLGKPSGRLSEDPLTNFSKNHEHPRRVSQFWGILPFYCVFGRKRL